MSTKRCTGFLKPHERVKIKKNCVIWLLCLGITAIHFQNFGETRENGTPPPVTTAEGMVLIPAGEFQMGSNDKDAEGDEQPVHSVYVDAFYIDAYEVTNAEYAAFLNAKRKHEDGGRLWLNITDLDVKIVYIGNVYRALKGYEDHPIAHVSWYGAMAYAEWVGKRLPTEAEWEKAARGNLTGQKYPWGNTIDATRANYNRHIGGTTPVGQYLPNGYGLYDMAGNAWEWCLDAYQSDFYVTSPYQNPVSGAKSIQWLLDNYTNINQPRVLRGGSWAYVANAMRCARRDLTSPVFRGNHSGFRCVRAVSP